MDQPDADGIGIGGPSVPQSPTPPPHPSAFRVHIFRSDPGIIMRITLHDGARNTYYGQWPRSFSKKAGFNRRSIAQSGMRARRLIHSRTRFVASSRIGGDGV
jgi:hypothetical protein